ncbi:MAG: TOBE domain-containing protein [Spirochaetales bacterium]|nr:TOBE domain-containing protein [Spirochaetales bacterium]
MTMADKIVVMKAGVIQQIGSPLELYNNPVNRFVAGFIGSPPMNFMTVSIKEEGGKIVAEEEGGNQLEVSGENADRIKSYVGKDLIFGVRPEDLNYQDKGGSDKTIKTSVTVIEPLGAEIHLYVDTGKHSMIARVPPRMDFHVGDDAFFEADMNKVLFFDMETEKALVGVEV